MKHVGLLLFKASLDLTCGLSDTQPLYSQPLHLLCKCGLLTAETRFLSPETCLSGRQRGVLSCQSLLPALLFLEGLCRTGLSGIKVLARSRQSLTVSSGAQPQSRIRLCFGEVSGKLLPLQTEAGASKGPGTDGLRG